MSRRRSNVARPGSPDPVLVSYAGSDAAAPSVSYIVCLNGRVPEIYEVWCLNREGVREVHPTARVKLFTLFDENIFGALSMIPEDSVFLLSVVKASTVVLILSAIWTSLWTVLRTLFLLKISSFIPGDKIRL